MAITIQDFPSNTVSVNDEMIFVVYEAVKVNDEVTYPDYRYVLDLYVDDVFAARIKARPDPEFRMGIFNVATILRSYVEYVFKANYANYTETLTAKVSYKVKLGEEYGDTTYTNLTVDSSARYAFKSYAVRPFDDSSVVVNNELQSNIPKATVGKIYTYPSTKWLFTNVYNDTYTAGGFPHNIILYNASGGIQGVVNKTTSPTPATDGQFLQMNDSLAAFLARGEINQTAFNNTVKYRIAWATCDIDVYLLCEGKYNPVTLAWLNPYGVYDCYDFGLVSKKQVELKRRDFAQLNYRINVSGVMSYSNEGVFYGSRRGYATDVKTTLKLTSHLLSAEEYTWLADLFISPDVLMYDEVREKFHPVVISETNYEFRNYSNSKLLPLEFNVQFSDNYNAQFK